MSSLVEFKKATARNQYRAEPAQIWKARNFISEHFTDELSLAKVVKAVSISANHLSETFKQVTGTNFVEYVSRTRFQKAHDLLRNSDLRVSEIAFAVGFQSLSQFNRVFKRLSGKPPTAVRAASLQRSEDAQRSTRPDRRLMRIVFHRHHRSPTIGAKTFLRRR